MTKQSVVIVGGGFGGVRAALELANEPFAEVTLVSDRSDFFYFPALYHTAVGGSDKNSSTPLTQLLHDKPIKLIIAKATGLDTAAKLLQLEDKQSLTYDKLIIALGVLTNYFGIPSLPKNTYGIKSIAEVDRLKRHLHAQLIAQNEPDLNYVIVGGGSTGIELAGDLGAYLKDSMHKHGIKHRAVHIDLVEAMPHLMPRMPKPVGRTIERRLRQLGVKLYLNSKVEGATGDELMVSGKPIRSHTIIWTAGIANNPFFTTSDFTFSGRKKVLVDEFLRAEGSKDIFIIGDNAETPFSGMAQTAIYDADFVVHNLRFEQAGRPKLAYRAKEPVYITPVGDKWATVLWGDLHLHGRLGWWLRKVADLRTFLGYEPLTEGTEQWAASRDHEDLCPICSAAS
jgi:NADH dehydrogenase